MNVPTVAVVNEAQTPIGVDIDALIAASNVYVKLLKIMGWPVACNFVKASKIPDNAWAMVFLDNADVAGALGYHDVSPNGLPYTRVFVQTAIQNGEHPCVTFSHELGEMLVDPMGEQLRMDLHTGNIYPYEIADPVEETTFELNGIPFSNFILPEWFQSWPGATRWDFMNVLLGPFTLAAGGYVSVIMNGIPTDVFGSHDKKRRFALEDRRGHRTTLWKSRVYEKLIKPLPGK